MPTTRNKTVKSSGGDYSSLSGWDAGEQADLPTLDEIRQAECFGFVDTTSVTIDGWTTDATRYLRVYATSGAEATLPYTSSGYRLELTAPSDALAINEDYWRVEHISIKATQGAGSNSVAFQVNPGAGEGRILGCLVKLVRNTQSGIGIRHGGTGGNVIVVNSVSYSSGAGSGACSAFVAAGSGGNCYFYNCTAYNCEFGFSNGNNQGLICKNCLYDRGSITVSQSFGNTAAGTDYNASTETGAPGAHSRSSQTFTFVDTSTGDFHLASGDGGAKDFGVDLSGDPTYPFSNDFDNATRSGSWDIGADEITAATTKPTGPFPTHRPDLL